MSKGILVVISGPSGAGKSTICTMLESQHRCARSISATTRAPRHDEVDGKDYLFLDTPTFERMVQQEQFAEHAKVYQHYYGTPAAALEKALEAGKVIVMDVDTQGARQLRRRYPEALTVFLMPPDITELKRRLQARDTDSMQQQQLRLAKATDELSCKDEYDAIVVNDNLEVTLEQIMTLIHKRRKGE